MSMVPIYPMILFGGTGTDVQLEQGKNNFPNRVFTKKNIFWKISGKYVLNLEGGWIKVVTHTHKIAELMKDVRAELDQVAKLK